MLGGGGYAARPDPPAGGSGSIGVVQVVTPRKSVKRHNGRCYWLTRDVSLGFARLCPPGRILGTQTFRAARVFRILPTHFSGCRHRRSLATQTFFGLPSPSQLRFSYGNFSGGRGFAFYLHTLSGRFLRKLEQNDVKFETFSGLRAAFFSRNP